MASISFTSYTAFYARGLTPVFHLLIGNLQRFEDSVAFKCPSHQTATPAAVLATLLDPSDDIWCDRIEPN